MSLFRRHQDEPREARTPQSCGEGRLRVVAEDGSAISYAPDDFDEIFTTTDEHEAHRHIGLGWLLLEEYVGPGTGPDHEELVVRLQANGGSGGLSPRTVPITVGPEDQTRYVLGHLKLGRSGRPC